ncbi:hypothetical protein KPH14_010274 [Odynerus spinipes]|uniref:Uncharacterized protein n=1 Tax=Odynerus spinipes TaxID=1348599 RepID=A0AAD9RTH5_9HYME|nr:hypothetical protein KPH14_010274 [Odynerus spinipes]
MPIERTESSLIIGSKTDLIYDHRYVESRASVIAFGLLIPDRLFIEDGRRSHRKIFAIADTIISRLIRNYLNDDRRRITTGRIARSETFYE